MRILLDSRDLIDLVERDLPVAARDFDAYLRTGLHEIVLSFTNVRELAGPLAAGAEFLRMRPLLQSLERMPHAYLREIPIVALEIQSAVDAFNNGNEYAGPSPYVRRWDYTLTPLPGQRSAADDWINLRLDEIIWLINRSRPEVFAPPGHHLATLQARLQADRANLRAGQAPGRLHFAHAIRNHATTRGIRLPEGRGDEFAEWVYANPNRCPGLRLSHEVYRALMGNYTDVPETGDFSDLAHVTAIPYVDVATLDRRMRSYCGIASRKLLRLGCATNYAELLYHDVTALMRAHP